MPWADLSRPLRGKVQTAQHQKAPARVLSHITARLANEVRHTPRGPAPQFLLPARSASKVRSQFRRQVGKSDASWTYGFNMHCVSLLFTFLEHTIDSYLLCMACWPLLSAASAVARQLDISLATVYRVLQARNERRRKQSRSLCSIMFYICLCKSHPASGRRDEVSWSQIRNDGYRFALSPAAWS